MKALILALVCATAVLGTSTSYASQRVQSIKASLNSIALTDDNSGAPASVDASSKRACSDSDAEILLNTAQDLSKDMQTIQNDVQAASSAAQLGDRNGCKLTLASALVVSQNAAVKCHVYSNTVDVDSCPISEIKAAGYKLEEACGSFDQISSKILDTLSQL
jgi:hypothetical protein